MTGLNSNEMTPTHGARRNTHDVKHSLSESKSERDQRYKAGEYMDSESLSLVDTPKSEFTKELQLYEDGGGDTRRSPLTTQHGLPDNSSGGAMMSHVPEELQTISRNGGIEEPAEALEMIEI